VEANAQGIKIVAETDAESVVQSEATSRADNGNPTLTPAPKVPDYDLLRRIGSGSYGEVWLARNVTGAYRAVKVVHRHNFDQERPFEREFEGIQNFERISRTHESQVNIFHVGKNESAGYFYYVMELADAAEAGACDQYSVISDPSPPAATPALSGLRLNTDDCSLITSYSPKTLRSELRLGRLPVARCVEIGLRLTSALAHLHKHGLVHRDVKPSNIIFVNGAPKLADIGLVTEAGDSQPIVGTEGYIAPEGPGSAQADIFSLGKVLYEISTGQDRRKFPDLPPKLKEWPDQAALLELNEVLLKACARDPQSRSAKADVMRDDLKLLAEGHSMKRRQAWRRRARLGGRNYRRRSYCSSLCSSCNSGCATG
jgi:eukaryotic-like serine/threonine-protein kinase